MSNKLAILGGEPVRKEFLSFHQPLIGQEEEMEVIDTLRSGWITTAQKTKRFEEMFKEYIGVKFAIGVNSCTAALHLGLVASNIGHGDEVITTPITFAATANVIIHRGAKPVFVDVEPDTLNIDAAKIEEKITKRTKAIVPVHFTGHPCEMDKILEIAKKYNLMVMEDAAHALESKYHGQKVGQIGDIGTFSFYATKNITTGEGGMLTTNNEEIARMVQIMALHGLSQDAWKRYSEAGWKHYDVIYAGYKYNMFDIQAALGLHQLAKAEDFLITRQKYVQMYDEAFKDIPQIKPLARRENIKHAHHLFVVIVDTDKISVGRDDILTALKAENIGMAVHFRALHLQPFYREKFGFKQGDLPLAEYASDRIISLPLYPKMTTEDVEDVIKAVKKVIGFYSK